MVKKVAFYTLGCKVNSAESDVLAATFHKRGYTVVDFSESSDICVINTCTVTHQADAQCRQVIRQARKRSPEAVIAVVGCYAQADPHTIAGIPGVDLILGTKEKFSIFEHLNNNSCFTSPVVETDLFADPFESEKYMSYGTKRTRAFLKVQDGCSYKCTYCIIPQVRGPGLSRKKDDVIDRVCQMRDAGYREIVVTAVNLGEYSDGNEGTLTDLILELKKVSNIPRIRLTSIEPNCISENLVKIAADSGIICPHFHVPLQSGSDEVLKKMRRRYGTSEYAASMDWIARYLPHAAIGADVMVGFPGETDEQFEESAKFIRNMPITYLHVFRYSPRAGTEALKLDQTVRPETARRRSRELIRIGLQKKEEFLQKQMGTVAEVLFETEQADGQYEGFSGNYVRVRCSDIKRENTLASVEITGKNGMLLSGALHPKDCSAKIDIQVSQ